jgi:cytochrome c-type biogenesis protein CcmH
MKRWFLLLLFCLAGCAPAAVQPGLAATQPVTAISDDQVNAVARQLYCPICENISLDVCPTEACARWRELIREKLAAGWSVTQIKTYFASQYGDQVLPEPPLQGFNWLAYLLPLALPGRWCCACGGKK